MLNVYIGDMPHAIYNTATYFKHNYKDEWITDELCKQMIADVDKSIVHGPNSIESPVLGSISPHSLSGGVKTLILIYKDRSDGGSKVFNASTCGDNCAKWLLEIARRRDRQHKKTVINLRHLMDFGDEPFRLRILNENKVVENMGDFVLVAGKYLGGTE